MYPDGRMQAAEFTKLSADYEGAHYTQRLREKQAADSRFIAKNDGTPFVRGTEKVSRNGPCPCGSGKKFKQCHGRNLKPGDDVNFSI